MKTFQVKRVICHGLLVMFMFAGIQTHALADIVSTSDLSVVAELDGKRDQLKSLFARDDVKQQLIAMGVAPDNAVDRVDGLSNAEVLAIHGKLAEIPAGEGAIGAVLGVLLILILLDVTGLTDIFPKI